MKKTSITDSAQLEIIVNEMGNYLTPSVVSFSKEGEILVGEASKVHHPNLLGTTAQLCHIF